MRTWTPGCWNWLIHSGQIGSCLAGKYPICIWVPNFHSSNLCEVLEWGQVSPVLFSISRNALLSERYPLDSYFHGLVLLSSAMLEISPVAVIRRYWNWRSGSLTTLLPPSYICVIHFGSDYPFVEQLEGGYAKILAAMDEWQGCKDKLTPQDWTNIYGATASRIYRIPLNETS